MRYLLHVKRDSGQVMVAAAVPDGEPLPFDLSDDSCDIHAVGELGYDRVQDAMPFVCYDAHGAVIPGDQPTPDHQFDFKARGWVIDPGIAWERVKQQRAAAIASGFEWNGSVFQTRSDDLNLISGRAAALNSVVTLGLAGLDDDFYIDEEGVKQTLEWRSLDDDYVPFTIREFLKFGIAVDGFVKSKFKESWNANG